MRGASNRPQGGTGFRMLMAQFWTLAQSKYISKGVQKWTLLGLKVVPPGGSVFGLFILSDLLKLCRLPCAQNVKLEATLTQTASAAGILNCTSISHWFASVHLALSAMQRPEVCRSATLLGSAAASTDCVKSIFFFPRSLAE